jgi:hypothetical protein
MSDKAQQMIDAINRYRAGMPIPIWVRASGRGRVELPRVSGSWQADERLYWKVWHKTMRQDPRQRIMGGNWPQVNSELGRVLIKSRGDSDLTRSALRTF